MKKLYSKTLVFLLAFALCLTMIVPAAFAADNEESEAAEPSVTERAETAKEETEAKLSIRKTSDKSTYSVGESINFTISLDELTEGAAATDVIIKDTMPDGIHIKNVTVDGADDAEVTLMESAKNSNSSSADDTKDDVEDEEEPDANVELTDDESSAPADTTEPADTDTDDNNDSDSDETESSDQIYYALVPITSETEENYIFYDPSGNEIVSILFNTEDSTDDEGNPCVIQSYVFFFDAGGDQTVDIWVANEDGEGEEYKGQITVSFLPFESENSAITTYAATADEISDAITTYATSSASNEEKALEMAKLTLSVAPCSYEGLIDLLVFDGYSEAEATYAADNCGADWYEQACLDAEVFLNVSPLSYKGLIEMLEVEKFTVDQATYAANNCGADWYEQAVKSGEVYLSIVDIDYEWLIRLLETEGFTTEEATYAANVLFGYEAEKPSTEKETSTVDGVEIYIPSIEYGQNVKVTIEAYAEEAGEYTNTATATSAETDTVSDSVTIKVQNSSSDDGLNNNGSGQTSGTGTNGSGTTTTTSPKTGELIGFGTLAIIALAAGAILVVTVVTGKHKENN